MHGNDRGRTKSKLILLFESQKGLCLYCEAPIDSNRAVVDHIWPKSRGGSGHIENLALVCYTCNAFKSDFTSSYEVSSHLHRVFRMFFHIEKIDKVKNAMARGRMNGKPRKNQKHGGEGFPNAFYEVGEAPNRAQGRSVRVEAFQRRVAAFQRIKASSARSTEGSKTLPPSPQDS